MSKQGSGIRLHKRIYGLLYACAVLLLAISCNKKVAPPPSLPEKIIEYIVQDCTIVVPADTTALFLKWSELCDTSVRSSTVPVINTVKKNRLTITTRADSNGVTFICREDSLLQVIEMLRQSTVETFKQGATTTNGSGIPQYTILLLAIACAVFGLVMLFRR